jgi:hypothetical protein
MAVLSLEDLDSSDKSVEEEVMVMQPEYNAHSFWRVEDAYCIDELMKEYE